MSDSQHDAPTGPDFTAGIPTHTIADGIMLHGHVGDDSVLIARHDGQYYAIGATCTHWSAPLADGLLTGDTVRCPWHHACFSLKTGEALHAPALDPVSCYRVEEHNGLIFVREKLPSNISRPPLLNPPNTIVIIGAGAAGIAAADMLRRQGYTGTLHLIDARTTPPVDRPNLSKDYLAGIAQEDWIFLRPDSWYTDNNITLQLGTRVTKIDPSHQVVELDTGVTLPYDRLLLATGASPVALDIPGATSPHVHYLRTLEDSKAIIASAQHASNAVVIGSSFIGLEVAAALRTRGITVHVVAPEQHPLERIVGPELSEMVRTHHESHGVQFHLGLTATTIALPNVTLSNRDILKADFVVIGIGVRPELTLAEQAGAHIEKGVTVNQYLETTIPNIYAAGDIARWPDHRSGTPMRVEHWSVAQQQGQTAARNMLGAQHPFTAVPFFWSSHYNISIDYVGHAEHWDHLEIDGTPLQHNCTVRYRENNKTLAVATVGREHESLKAELVMEQ